MISNNLKITAMCVIVSIRAVAAEIDDGKAEKPLQLQTSMRTYNLIPSIIPENLQWAIGKAEKTAIDIDPTTLPSKVDFSHYLPIIHVQGALSSCTGQAITTAMEINLSKKNAFKELSPLFVYYNERRLMGTTIEDSGASLLDGIKAVCTWGSCKERTWTYSDDKIKFKVEPSDKAYNEGPHFMNLDSIAQSQVPHTLTAIKFVLSKEIPVVFGIFVFPSFEHCPMGKVPMPTPDESSLGGHALTFVGYNDETQEFKFVNSWGKTWGDNGFGYLKYDYVMNKSGIEKNANYFYANDIWSIEKVGPDETKIYRSQQNTKVKARMTC